MINVGKFIISEELYAHVGVTAVEVHSFQVRLKTIIDNYHKRGELDKHVRTEDDTDKINEHITDENIIKYRTGEEARKAEQLLEQFASSSLPIFMLNMTLQEVSRAKWDAVNKHYLIKVWAHKTNKKAWISSDMCPKRFV